jgi:sulfide:quinone oxidoreductase
MPTNVLIVGAGPAALEAALVFDRHAAGRVAVSVLAPEDAFTYRPLRVLEPFSVGAAGTYRLERIADDANFTHVPGRLARVHVAEHVVETEAGERIAYDVLLIAAGARRVAPFEHALTFTGGARDAELFHGLVQDVEQGYAHRIAFVVPAGNTWPLPLYELALMLADRAYDMQATVELALVTPEPAPLAIFGEQTSARIDDLLDAAGIEVLAGVPAQVPSKGLVQVGREAREFDRVITVASLQGPAVPGVPADADGFLVTDRHGRVAGAPDVYAAGDVTAYPIKQGGLACQQADAAAEHIAARAGAPLDPQPYRPVLRGMLLTERWARFMRGDESADHALWWPPTKIAGRELAGYLEGLDEQAGRATGGLPVLVEVDGGDSRQIEVLNMFGAK